MLTNYFFMWPYVKFFSIISSQCIINTIANENNYLSLNE
jgi:hypothetical protein